LDDPLKYVFKPFKRVVSLAAVGRSSMEDYLPVEASCLRVPVGRIS